MYCVLVAVVFVVCIYGCDGNLPLTLPRVVSSRGRILYRLNQEGEDFISTWDEVHETFDAMGLHENLLRGIYAYGVWSFFFRLLAPCLVFRF